MTSKEIRKKFYEQLLSELNELESFLDDMNAEKITTRGYVETKVNILNVRIMMFEYGHVYTEKKDD